MLLWDEVANYFDDDDDDNDNDDDDNNNNNNNNDIINNNNYNNNVLTVYRAGYLARFSNRPLPIYLSFEALYLIEIVYILLCVYF